MSPTAYTRARVRMTAAPLEKPSASFSDTDLSVIAQHLYALMLRNVATDGYLFNDPTTGEPSKPGCVIAAAGRGPGLRLQLGARRRHHGDRDRGGPRA